MILGHFKTFILYIAASVAADTVPCVQLAPGIAAAKSGWVDHGGVGIVGSSGGPSFFTYTYTDNVLTMNNPVGSGFRQCNCLAFDSPAAETTSAESTVAVSNPTSTTSKVTSAAPTSAAPTSAAPSSATTTSTSGSAQPCFWLNEGDTCDIVLPLGLIVGEIDVNQC
jgi:cell division septation protein DedD